MSKNNIKVEIIGSGGISKFHKDGYEKIEINRWDRRIEIYSILWNEPTGAAPLLRIYTEKDKRWREFNFPIINAFDEEIKYFLDCVEKGIQGKPDVFDGYAVDNVSSAAYE